MLGYMGLCGFLCGTASLSRSQAALGTPRRGPQEGVCQASLTTGLFIREYFIDMLESRL